MSTISVVVPFDEPKLLKLAARFFEDAAYLSEVGDLPDIFKDTPTVSHTPYTPAGLPVDSGNLNVADSTDDEEPAPVAEIEEVKSILEGLTETAPGEWEEVTEADAGQAFSIEEDVASAEAAFSNVVPIVPAPVAEAPTYERSDKEPHFTLDALKANGWTEALLIEHGYLVEVKKAPAAPTIVVAPAAPTAPMAPPPSLVVAPAPTSVAITSAVELDARGLPWDARINSAGDKRKLADGNWKIKRNTPDALVLSVETELRQLMASGKAPAPAPVAAPRPQTTAPAPTAGGVANINPVAAFLRRVNGGIKGGQLTEADVLAAVKLQGLNTVADINKPENHAKIPLIEAHLFKGLA